LLFSLGALSALATMPMLTDPRLPSSFDLMVALALASGVACALIPWNVLSPRWLHAVPMVRTVEVALAVWAAGSHGSIYGIYYVFVALFAACAFQSRGDRCARRDRRRRAGPAAALAAVRGR
jgi:hypothetical protein